MRLIDADELMHQMYRKAFIEDSNMQKWDSGCWIRYKMFELVVDSVPSVDAVIPVRCEQCVSYDERTNECNTYNCSHRPGEYCSWGIKRRKK